VQINPTGKKTPEGIALNSVEDISSYLLNEAKIALVPFTAFGANKNSTWFRLSAGTCRTEEIPEFFNALKKALDLLS
ncbi:MAG: pyridoxal phosphate-dependent aminotransferase, partial [Bacteroidetes bacterium]